MRNYGRAIRRLPARRCSLGCSERDAHIPLSRVEVSAARFAAAGAAVTTRIYPGSGHGVNDDEIGLVRTL